MGSLSQMANSGFLGLVAYGIDQSNRMKKEQEKMVKEQEANVAKLEAEKKLQEEKSSTQAASNIARQRQRAAAAGMSGRAGTILTSPLGVMGAPQTGGGKTLLGM